jgi:hypothetical protein
MSPPEYGPMRLAIADQFSSPAPGRRASHSPTTAFTLVRTSVRVASVRTRVSDRTWRRSVREPGEEIGTTAALPQRGQSPAPSLNQ